MDFLVSLLKKKRVEKYSVYKEFNLLLKKVIIWISLPAIKFINFKVLDKLLR